MKHPKQTIDWGGKRVVIEWIKTNSLEGMTPIMQVYGVCFNDKNEILISRKVGDEKWIIPGGHPEGNETIEETLRRELIEEADIKVKNIKVLGAQKIYPEKKPEEYIYQVRCICKLDKLLPQTIDPAENVNWERKFVPANKITEFVKWGVTGDAMFRDAINVNRSG